MLIFEVHLVMLHKLRCLFILYFNFIFFLKLKTIRAKLKQRVGHNRSKPVELHDIDSIMRNVVTIIQDEFMKRFPSGPSPNTVATASSTSN
jgi:hypothetical protein